MKLPRLAALLLALAAPVTGCSGGGATTGDEQNLTEKSAFLEVFRAQADGRWYYQLLAGGGEALLRSNGYASESSAKGGIETLKKNATTAARYKLEKSADGDWYVSLRGGNGQVIATGEPQATEAKAAAIRDWAMALAEAGVTVSAAADAEKGAELFRCGKTKKQHCFRVRNEGGEILLQSQRYSSKSAAETGLASVRDNGLYATQYGYDDSADGKQAWFRLHAHSAVEIEAQEVIGWSTAQASREAAYANVALLRAVLAHDDNDGGCQFATVAEEYALDVEKEGLVYGDIVEITPEDDISSVVHDQLWAQVSFYFPNPDNDEQDVFVWFDGLIRTREIRDPEADREYRAFEFSYDSVYSTIFPADSAETIELTAVDGRLDSCSPQ
jgi:uncharacterized protein YegP (UPF0339 family)